MGAAAPSQPPAPSPTRRVAAGLLLAAALLPALAPDPARAQARRDPAVVHASSAPRGRLLVGLGAAWGAGARYPVSALEGDLLRPAHLALEYAFADGAVMRVEGDVVQILDIEARGSSAIGLEPSVDDGRTSDTGEFRVGTTFRVAGGAEGWSAGFGTAIELPTTDQNLGLGLNTTDVFATAWGSHGSPRVRVTGELGMGLLEVPLQRFTQNDVLAYGAELFYRPGGGPWGLALGTEGHASLRSRPPPGTGEQGALTLGGQYRAGGWLLDAGVAAGYAGGLPDWELRLGVARLFGP